MFIYFLRVLTLIRSFIFTSNPLLPPPQSLPSPHPSLRDISTPLHLKDSRIPRHVRLDNHLTCSLSTPVIISLSHTFVHFPATLSHLVLTLVMRERVLSGVSEREKEKRKERKKKRKIGREKEKRKERNEKRREKDEEEKGEKEEKE